MRSSVLYRSLVATTTLAVAGGVLSAVPASAAASGITREHVIAAVAVVRADPLIDDEQSAETAEALRPLTDLACAINPAKEIAREIFGAATTADDNASGIFIVAAIEDETATDESLAFRLCLFGAVAVADPAFDLTGNATVSYGPSSSYPMSGDVFVTPPRNYTFAELVEIINGPGTYGFSVNGNATRSTTSTLNVTTPKTTTQKKTAKKKYTKSLSSAKKSYKKALKKAGHSKSKRAKAKKAHAKKRAAAKKSYQKAIATTRHVKTTTHVENRPIAMTSDD